MSGLVFVDTSAIYALMDRADLNHSQARRVWNTLVAEDYLVTNNYVLVESTALIQRRLGVAALRSFVQDLLPLIDVEWVSESQHQSAVEALLAAGRKKLSLVDCVSFQTMRTLGLRRAFSFDAHFKEQGFEIVQA